MFTCLRLIKIILLSILATVVTTTYATTNLLANPGFEDPQLTGWTLLAPHSPNSAELVSDVTHSGQAAIRLVATNAEDPGKAVQVYSSKVAVPADTFMETSFWIKASSIIPCGDPNNADCTSWYHLRAAYYVFDASDVLIDKSDFLSTEGDICATESTGGCDWRKIRTTIKTSSAASTLRIAVMLTTSTGTVWVDDFELKVVQSMPDLDFSGQSNPILIPPPWQMMAGNEKLPVNDIAVMNISGQDRLQQEISSYFAGLNITPAFDPINPEQYSTVLTLGGELDSTFNARFMSRFPDSSWSDIGEEGYFVSVSNDSQARIMIGANSERGRFYGMQSVKQLIKDGYVYVADILDRPQNTRRGMAVGVQWFNGGNSVEAFQRLAERKGNFAWNEGSYVGGKYLWNWREPFTSNELTSMQNYLSLANSKFIDVYLSFGPRIKQSTVNGASFCDEVNYPAPQFSDPAEADILVSKMLALYDRGYRNFGINFDDASICNEHRLRYPQDIAQFSDQIGVAHAHFVNQVYSRLNAIHNDINFMMIPLWYSRSSSQSTQQDDYLFALRDLDPAIELLTVQLFDEDVDTLTSLAQRPTMNWSNAFAPNKDAIYIMPYIDMMTWNPDKLTGFIFLPALPDTSTQNEDQALVSWNTALSYAWAPDRYDALEVFDRSGARYEGAQDPLPVVSAPVISPNGGNFSLNTPVVLATTTTGTEIYYTLDGSVPVNDGSSSASQLYTGPLNIVSTTIVSARAFRPGFVESQTVSATFTLLTFQNPSAHKKATSGDGNGYQTNPINAYAYDAAVAVDTNSGNTESTSCSNSGKDKHRFYNYGFSIPASATIKGIEVKLNAKVDNTNGSPKICVQLSSDGGSTWTTAQATTTLTTALEDYTLGGPANTWGHTWSVTNLSNANFRLRVINVASNTSRDFSLNNVAVKVTY